MVADSLRVQAGIDQALALSKTSGMEGMSVSCTTEQGFSVTARQGETESLEHHQQLSFVVTGFQKQRTAQAYTTDLTEQAVSETVRKVASMLQHVEADAATGLPDRSELADDIPDLNLSHDWSLTPKEAFACALDLEEQALALDKRIEFCDEASVSTYKSQRYFANTQGFQASYGKTRHSKSVGLFAIAGDSRESEYEYTQSRVPDALWDNSDVAKLVVDKLLARLGARQLTTRRCPVLFSPQVARSLWGSLISAVSGGSQYKQSSFLLGACGERLFPEMIQVSQTPHVQSKIGSAPFDAEGVRTRDYDLIVDGVLKQYILDSYCARKLGLETTGNSGGVYNLSVSPTHGSQADLLAQMGTGLLVTDLMGQGVNIATGTYSRGAFGYWVEGGVIQYPVEEITIASNLKDMFLGVLGVADDADLRGNLVTGSVLIDEMMVGGA